MANLNFKFRDINEALPRLLKTLGHEDCPEVGTRDGRRAREMTHIGITLEEPWRRELLLPDRKHNLAAQVAETMWVLAGRNDIEFLSHYLPRAADFSDDGKTWRGGYGPRIRGVQGANFAEPDQLANVVDTLRKDPLSRQAVISIYDTRKDCGVQTKDLPCNDFIQFTLRDHLLEMHIYIRSNDAIWGWSGINAFEWSALQEIVANLLSVSPGPLHFSVGSFHVYDTHWEKAARIAEGEIVDGAFQDSPWFCLTPEEAQTIDTFDDLVISWFEIEDAIREGKDMSDRIIDFPEPMLQSWLRVIAWWWTGDYGHLDELPRLAASASLAVQPPKSWAKEVWTTYQEGAISTESKPDFVAYVDNLHREKAKAYGDSWKRRGEMLSIMANIARKIDRLGRADIDGENATDTAIDLVVYLIKYRLWLADSGLDYPRADLAGLPEPPYCYFSDSMDALRSMLDHLDGSVVVYEDFSIELAENRLQSQFEELWQMVQGGEEARVHIVDAMLARAFALATTRYESL